LEFHIPSSPATEVVDYESWINFHIQGLKLNIDKFNERDSGLIFDGIESALFKISLLGNHSGRGSFKLPKNLKNKTAVINVDCESQCFKYAVLSILHYNDINANRNRTYSYRQWENELNFDDCNSDDMKIKDIEKFEKLNNIKIVLHVWEKGLKGVRYNSRSSCYERTVNLLLVKEDDSEEWHYCGIPKISRLYHHLENSSRELYYCDRCIRHFRRKTKFETHYEWCKRGKLQMERMPKDKEFSYRENGDELSPLRVIYADIECYIDDNIHRPAAISCYEVWHDHFRSRQNKMRVWQGEDCIYQFLQFLEQAVKFQQKHDGELYRRSLHMTADDQAKFDSCNVCPKCRKTFDDDKIKKVRDHDHITGKFRNALCSKCNFSLRMKRRTLPVIFHNFKGYDSHMIIKGGLGQMKEWKLDVIAQTREKFMAMTAKVPVDKTKENKTVYFDIKFLDSYQFMTASLASLVQNLKSLPLTQNLKKQYPNLTDEVITRKGVFPYAYFDAISKLGETSLPPIDKFKNDLTGAECKTEDYDHAQDAWIKFDCHTFGEYMIAYLKLDVFLLADVFQEFRRVALEEDKLDPVHFVSLPAMSFKSAFKMTGETIHLLQDPEMYNLFERGIRGGLTFVNKHRLKSETVGNDHTHLKYYDQNNLYGSSLSKPLPHSEFSWLDDSEIQHFSNPSNILAIPDEGDWGYYFEIDLIYPNNIKHKTVDFPVAPESGEVSKDMFSDFMKQFHKDLESCGQPDYKPCRKLLLTQYDKENYLVHFSILKFYLEIGMILKRVHRIIKFRQKAFLKPYIDSNSQKRALAQNNFEKDFYKYKNNSLFGKTMEDVRKRVNYKLVNDDQKYHKLVSSPLFIDRDIIDEDLIGVKMIKSEVELCKPIYIGQAVLDYSKLEMYQLFYKILKPCPLVKEVRLLGGDTDSFFLGIATQKDLNFNEVGKSLERYFDTSNYPADHPLYSIKNKAKLGCFKDETAGKEIDEMILLRPKMYSMKLKDSDDSIKRAKGISRSLVSNMKHKNFRKAYRNKNITFVNMTILKSKSHEIKTHTFRKRALSAWEDKRCRIRT
jgi:ssDNA-binding Zn-finger/Zn-ribbon topoisomerase 1